MRPLLPLTALLLVAGCSASPPAATVVAPPVDIATPPSGSLSAAQLATIADDIRELGDNPLGEGAVEGRATLFQWITGSPDVSVTLCAPITEPFTDVRGDTDRILFASIILNLAEQKIRAPEASREAQVTTAFHEALDTYEILLNAGQRRDRGLDALVEAREDGDLEAYVAEALTRC